jgi:hypothetical protein
MAEPSEISGEYQEGICRRPILLYMMENNEKDGTMSKQRNISFMVPKYLLEQIENRARLNGRKRNAEVRYLVAMALDLVGDEDFRLDLPPAAEVPWVHIPAGFKHETFSQIEERAERFERSVGREIVRLAGYALQETANRDIKLLADLMQHQDPAGPARSETGPSAFPPSPEATLPAA